MQRLKWPLFYLHIDPVWSLLIIGTSCTLGRAPRTKETLPDFREWCRVTRHPRVFRGLAGCQRTPRFMASQKTLRKAWPRCSPKQRNTSTTRKPFYLSGKTLPCKRRKAGARKSESGASGGEDTGDRSPRRDERTENNLQRQEATSGIAWAHLNSSCSNDIHPGNSPP